MGVRGTFRLGRILGIDLYLHWSWFVVAIIEIQWRAGAYSAITWNVFEYLALFLIVTVHEFGHALACRSVGGSANRIVLWPLGGIAYVDPPPRPGATLWSIAAGPLVNVALTPVLGAFWYLGQASAATLGANAVAFLQAVFLINVGLLLFNILPVYPLDGGQILRSLLWFPLGRARSLMVSAVIGFIGVAVLGVYAFDTRDIWLGAILVFLLMNCWSGLRHAFALGRRAKLPRHDGFRCPWCASAPLDGAYWRCRQCQIGFDPFATAGHCPACQATLDPIVCPDCGHWNSAAAWSANTIATTSRPAPVTSA